MVGTGRFELPTPCTQNRCATRLRHAPTICGWFLAPSQAFEKPKFGTVMQGPKGLLSAAPCDTVSPESRMPDLAADCDAKAARQPAIDL